MAHERQETEDRKDVMVENLSSIVNPYAAGVYGDSRGIAQVDQTPPLVVG